MATAALPAEWKSQALSAFEADQIDSSALLAYTNTRGCLKAFIPWLSQTFLTWKLPSSGLLGDHQAEAQQDKPC